MTLRVAVVGSGPGGSSAAEVCAQAGFETYLIEKNLSNAKPCGGAIPLCMVDEFDLPESIIDRRVRNMSMISPSNHAVDISLTNQNEYIGMCRREVLDSFLRNRAAKQGTHLIEGTFTELKRGTPYTLEYRDKAGRAHTLSADIVIGADGFHSKIAKTIDAGEVPYAIAFQERIQLPPDKMAYYEDRAEMYLGFDVSPDFYAWIFPKSTHVAVGTGTMSPNKDGIRRMQQALRARAGDKIAGGKIIKIEAHPLPERSRPRRVVERVMLVGDAAGYVTKSSGEGIYFAAKSGRMAAQAIVEAAEGGRLPTEAQLQQYVQRWDKQYGLTYRVLSILQDVFYRSDATREAFVEMCADRDVQRLTFDSYLYKTVVPANPLVQAKITLKTLGSLIRGNALAPT
ncbi:geranylgeranyl reductase [Gloeobacter kilaueensis]|uniref:Geranylgeranyl reductase n=1 Tax=Gloeobacter kilaueensis (strain ATCC BAA-2537 / CCAP 1431/1 / ULC 316 / JS1) TaxID=1183438 RepID=U5QPS7_GLOK1|nr:geranylgeranyl reductase [Gloeobacter kilaueensis]AGY59700.1 geranylgeranyl reductase [Gloeobacter kilaueensis JS1]